MHLPPWLLSPPPRGLKDMRQARWKSNEFVPASSTSQTVQCIPFLLVGSADSVTRWWVMTHSVENGFGAPCAPLPDGTHALSFAPPPQKPWIFSRSFLWHFFLQFCCISVNIVLLNFANVYTWYKWTYMYESCSVSQHHVFDIYPRLCTWLQLILL